MSHCPRDWTPRPVTSPIRAISLDFANTLYPFRVDETDQSIHALYDFLHERLRHDLPRDPFLALYRDIRARQFTENRPTLRENDFTARIRALVAACDTGAGMDAAFVAEAEDVYADAFVRVMRLPPGALETVRRLADTCPVAVLSNFPRTDCIVRPLERDGLLPLLHTVIVSADVGYIKPHPAMFAALCQQLNLPPSAVLHVGDDWDADIIGAGNYGIMSAYTTEWRDERDPFYGQGDAPPLFEIARLQDLPERINAWNDAP